MSQQKRNARSVLVDRVVDGAPPGAIVLTTMPGKGVVGISHNCPCGCGKWGWIAFKEYGFPDYWERRGSWDNLTLTPSIGFARNQTTGQFHWHGWLKNGVFEEG